MRCPACRTENLPDSLFCTECGAKLEVPCPSCGAANPAAAKFCRRCGRALDRPERPPAYTPKHLAEKILTSRAAVEGERKQVTVLFADVKGSMELAAEVDPEEWHQLLDGFFQILTEGIHRFEGTVNQYTGDGVMALFGAPIAHEDHAQRACYAALSIREELRRFAHELKRERGLVFSVRMGINSGEVVVGKIGDDLRMDYTAQGHTVGLAARMEQLASPDTAYLTGSTAALVSGFFELRDLGTFNVKGAAGPVPVFELRGPGRLRTRLDLSRQRGFSRFVGRDDEIRLLDRALERALDGNGQVVGVVAEPGVGKSRLCFEFAMRCRARAIDVYEAHGVAHARMIPFLPVLELLRGYFGIGERDGGRAAREKIAGRILLLDERFREDLPILFEFLGVSDPERPAPPLDPESRQYRFFTLMKRLLHAASRREPIVYLIEDLQWIDGGTEAFLRNLVDSLAGTRILLVVNFRPEYRTEWMQRSYYQQLAVAPLGAAALEELLSALLGVDPSLADLRRRVRERTAGNPFFLEEVVRSLAESGTLAGTSGAYQLTGPVDAISFPASVQAVLAARIDRLDDREKRLLETAAVIGIEFSEAILRRVAGLGDRELAASLHVLRAGEFVYEQALQPEAVHAFKHPLTQEVAYRSQLGERRARAHRAVAEAIAEVYAGALDERAALLAHHWENAGEALEAARWYRRAARHAGTSHPSEMMRCWRKVRSLVLAMADSAEAAALRLQSCTWMLWSGWQLGISREEAAALFREGRSFAGSVGDRGLEADLFAAYGFFENSAGDVAESVDHAEEALRLAAETDDVWLRLSTSYFAAQARWTAGDLRRALAICEEAARLLAAASVPFTGPPGTDPAIDLTVMRAKLLSLTGRHADAFAEYDRALALARDRNQTLAFSWVYALQTTGFALGGDGRAALAAARQAVELAERTGSPFYLSLAYEALGEACSATGDWDEAVAALESSLAIVRESRALLVNESWTLAFLAETLLGRGDVARAAEVAEEAVAIAVRRRIPVTESLGRLARARVLLASRGAAAAGEIERELVRARELVEQTGATTLLPRIHVEQARLARLAGDEEAVARELREARRLFTEMGAVALADRLARDPP